MEVLEQTVVLKWESIGGLADEGLTFFAVRAIMGRGIKKEPKDRMMANPKPKKNTRGRPKGVQNKMTIEIKEAIRQALEEVGGVSYLVQVAREHPQVFCSLLGRMIPLEQHHTAKGLPTAITIVRAIDGNSSN